MEINRPIYQNDDINLSDFWATLVHSRTGIISVALITTLSALLYVFMAKPVYSGEVLIEIGDMVFNGETKNDKPMIIKSIEEPNDLKEAIGYVLISIDDRKNEKMKVESPKGSTRLIKISYEDHDPKVIVNKLQECVTFILKRHEIKGAFYQQTAAKISPSTVVGAIEITADPIKPKKVLIVITSLIGGLMLGILIALFKKFGMRRGKIDDNSKPSIELNSKE
jgi:capsular polysaccharide biosynthesis protein